MSSTSLECISLCLRHDGIGWSDKTHLLLCILLFVFYRPKQILYLNIQTFGNLH